MKGNAIHWFRLGLRLADNESFLKAATSSIHLYPIFIVEEDRFVHPDERNEERMSDNRHCFLLQCLTDLDLQLKEMGSQLIVLYGEPVAVLEKFSSDWNINLITMEQAVGPYARERDSRVAKWGKSKGIEIFQSFDQLLNPMSKYPAAPPGSYGSHVKVVEKLGNPKKPVAKPDSIPAPDKSLIPKESFYKTSDHVINISLKFEGGERIAVKRLASSMSDAEWVSTFAKPMTSPNSLEPSTTVLSPYLAMGCLSPRQFWHAINDTKKLYKGRKDVTLPPTSLIGQLYWREMFYLHAWKTPNFNKMEGNPKCKQIDWDDNPAFLDAWTHSKTGFPYIDAIMNQLRAEGWIHHLARHSVACFLTRGDLYLSWEQGAKVFEKYLLDGDYAVNNANWQWLSASQFFHQYYRVYSPIKFGQKTDPKGLYIRKWIPQLASIPDKYIYEPWTAPLAVQKKSNCIIGTDYPHPIVDHATISATNIARIKEAYANQPTSAKSAGAKRKAEE